MTLDEINDRLELILKMLTQAKTKEDRDWAILNLEMLKDDIGRQIAFLTPDA